MLLPKTTRNTLKYHLVTVELRFTVRTIDWMHQTGPRTLLSVTHMLYDNQDSHSVDRCVLRQARAKVSRQWDILLSQQM